MNSQVKYLVAFILMTLVAKESIATFAIQFLGDYLTDEQYYKEEKCLKRYCIIDGDELFYAASRNSSILPCDDFKEFALGTFFKYRALNERYPYIGFQIKVQELLRERQRIVLKKPIKETEPKIFKVIKRYFSKCTNSDLIRKDGVNDITAHLMKLGGSPLLANGTWDDESYNIKTLFLLEPGFALKFLFNQILARCEDPRNVSQEILCFKKDEDFKFAPEFESDVIDILKPLKLNTMVMETGVKNLMNFMREKEAIQNKSSEDDSTVVTIKDLSEIISIPIGWLEFINSLLFSNSQIEEDEEIMISNLEVMKALGKLLMNEDKRLLADTISSLFLYEYRDNFIVYANRKQDSVKYGTIKSVQRFESCIVLLWLYKKVALDAMTAEHYFNKEAQDSATTFAMEALADVVDVIDKEIDDEEAKNGVIAKLKSAKFSIMSPDEILDHSKIDEFYEDFDVDSSESLLRLHLGMERHYQKLVAEKKSSWKKKLNRLVEGYTPSYLTDENVLVVPIIYAMYPWYHQKRPRFFNTATFYISLVHQFTEGARGYLKKEYNVTAPSLPATYVLADENYVKWEANGGRDLNLSPFKLNNRQMLWMSIAHASTIKFQSEVSAAFKTLQLQSEYLHVRFKNIQNFREAFHCGEMSEKEKETYAEYCGLCECCGK